MLRRPAFRLPRSSAWSDALGGLCLVLAGSVVLVSMCMAIVMVVEMDRKGAGIVLAVAGVWLLSRGGALLYRLLVGYPQ